LKVWVRSLESILTARWANWQPISPNPPNCYGTVTFKVWSIVDSADSQPIKSQLLRPESTIIRKVSQTQAYTLSPPNL